MKLISVGLNHRTAPVGVRERVAFNDTERYDLLRALARSSILAEAAVLCTCNRFEVYGLATEPEAAVGRVCAVAAESRGIPAAELEPYLRRAEEDEAARHLFRVAAGLDSMILGEPQILGQVTDAYEAALGCEAAGPALAALFRQAIHCGKRARAETRISEHAVSVSHAAVELTRQIFGSLGDRRVLLVGAGEMAELAARNLADNGAGQILVVNRSRGRAEALARQFGGLGYGWEELNLALCRADIVICSAAAPHTVIGPDTLRSPLVLRHGQPLFLIDIAVPRNVDPAVAGLPGVYLYDIDDLQTVVQVNLAQRQREVPRVEAIVEECLGEFMAWLHSLDAVEIIRDLRTAAEQVRDEELARALRRLGPLSEHEERVVRTMANNIVSKLLHRPTVRLKQLAEAGDGYRTADVLRDLFGLSCAPGEESHG